MIRSSLKPISSNIGGNGIDPVYMDWKDEWDVMMEAFEDRCDNCVYIMRNMESEEARQTKFFRKDDKDEKKKNVLAALVGMEYFLYDSEVGGLNFFLFFKWFLRDRTLSM